MNDLIENRQGWWWPKTDLKCWNYMLSHPLLPQEISKFVGRKRVCVQAGGNMGYYVKQYSNLFDTVYTFEPEWLNFYCLNLNVIESNVFKYQSCIGNQRDGVSLKIKEGNRGKNHVHKTGPIPTLMIDDLNLSICDLIHLDIEGFEFFAIQGAVKTINACKPIIAFEYYEKTFLRFNYTLGDIENWLKTQGYVFLTNFEEERIYIPSV